MRFKILEIFSPSRSGFGTFASWMVLLLSFIGTLVAWHESRNSLETRLQSEFNNLTSEIQGRLKDRVANYTQVLRSASALFAASAKISREDWHNYISQQNLSENYPAILAVAFAKHVKSDQLPGFIAEMRNSGLLDFAIRPPGERENYVVNTYSEPFTDGNVRALGYDMWQDPERRATMEKAAQTGLPMITRRVVLKIDERENPVPAFIMYMPVRVKGEIYGYVLSPFRMPDMSRDLLGSKATLVNLAIYDGETPADENLFYRSGEKSGRSPLYSLEKFEIGGRIWSLEFSSRQELETANEINRPILVLFLGITFNILLFLITWSLSLTKNRAQAIAEEKTRDLRANQELLEKQAEELRRSNAELEQFAYIASHDLQEPLRMISMYAQLIKRRYHDKLEVDDRQFINFMVEGSSRMQAMILDLLEFSRIGRKEDPLQEMEAQEGLTEALSNLAAAIQETGATIEHDLLPKVKVRRHQFVALLQNLIGNALKYRSPDRKPHIRISVHRSGNFWEFAIKDNGIGINPEFYDKIFLIFQRLHTRETYQGSGVGLAICKKIVEHHDGKIWLSSNHGQGTCFYFTLPAE